MRAYISFIRSISSSSWDSVRECRGVYTYTVVVNDLDDGSELAGARSVVDENDATDLNVALESGIRGHD